MPPESPTEKFFEAPPFDRSSPSRPSYVKPFSEEEYMSGINSWATDSNQIAMFSSNFEIKKELGTLSEREQKLAQKERELERRELLVQEREVHIRDLDIPPANWPRCKPIIYHSISDDIPPDAQSMVKRVYFAWYFCFVTYLINTAACFSILITAATTTGGLDFGISLIYLIVGVPVAFVFWYRPLYNGIKKDRSILFVFFFICYGFHLALLIFLGVGAPATGGSGFINMLQVFAAKKLVPGILCAIATGFLFLQVLYGLWQIKSAYSYFRRQGFSLDKAKGEAVIGIATSDLGKNLAREAALRSA